MKVSKTSSSRKAKVQPRHRNQILVGVVALAVLGLGLVTVLYQRHAAKNTITLNISILNSLQHKANAAMQPAHLATGLLPPTNRWFSGLVFGTTPQPVYPLPLSFLPSNNGFTAGLPMVRTTSDTVFGSYNPAVAIGFGSDSYQVSRYDAVSATLRYYKADKPVAAVTIAEGSPFVSSQFTTETTLTLPAGFSKQAEHVYSLGVGAATYGLYTTAAYAGGTALRVVAGDALVLYPVANDSSVVALAAYAKASLASVTVTNAATANTEVTTKLAYHTASGQPTIYAALPEQRIMNGRQLAGSYDTIYGQLKLYAGNSFTFSVPATAPASTISLTKLTTSQRQELAVQVQTDAAGTQLTKTDSYFGGKELYRTANLYQLALQLGLEDVAAGLHTQLANGLGEWLDPAGYQTRSDRYFYYDTTVKGLVAAQPSFGSEDFNDHHFHYGYFLYAAAVLGQHDKGFVRHNRAMLNLIASDIAAPTASQYFPQERLFDPYFGHSWASGNGTFADGNNQESSSEAANAWNAVALWGQVSGQTAFAQTGSWMLSREAATSLAGWTNIDTSQPEFSGYAHNIVSINWGGKRDYATFFSADPNAIFGIQLIPMNPSMSYLARATDGAAKLAAAVPSGDYNVQFADYLLMYRALADKSGALAAAKSLDSSYIDGANSKAYLLAWIMSR